MIAYLDTSALVKLFLAEPGGDIVAAVWDAAHGRTTSATTYPEARSALAAAVRGRQLTRRQHVRAVEHLDRLIESIDVVEVRRPLALAAGALAERFALRGCDAVHLASAEFVGAGRTVMVTWDRALATAAAGSGFDVIPPPPSGV